MKKTKFSPITAGDHKLAFAFLLPGMLFVTVFVFIPIIYSVYMSLYEWTLFDLGRDRTFVAFDNFTRAFSDRLFANAVGNTLRIVFFCVIIEMILGFLIALCLWNIKRSLKVIHTIILLPMITAPVVVALIWRFIFDPQFGILNYVLRNAFGITGLAWLGDPNLSLPSIMIVEIWQMTAFVVLVLYAGLTVVPMDSVEAALIDGASYWQTIRRIIIPFLMPLALLVMMIRTMDVLRIFDTIFVLTRGGPGSSTEVLSSYIYRAGFQNFEMGYALALSLITLVGILIISLGYVKAMKQKDGG